MVEGVNAEQRVSCPTCGASGYEPCRVNSHRDQRERKDHKARIATDTRTAAKDDR